MKQWFQQGIVIGCLLACMAVTALPARLWADDYFDSDFNSNYDSDCNKKQKDLVDEDNKNRKVNKTVNQNTGANDQLKQATQSIGSFPSSISSMPFGNMLSSLMGMIQGMTKNMGSFGSGGGDGSANSQALVTQNPDSCKSKNRKASLQKKSQDPTQNYSGPQIQPSEY